MIITIAGPPGSGKDSVAKLLAEKLDYNVVSLGGMKRDAAVSKGMTIEQYNNWSKENSKEGDTNFDNFLVEYGKENDNFIMVARLGWYFIPNSKKVFIDVDSKVGAERIFNQKINSYERGNTENTVCSIEEQENMDVDRIDNERERFLKLYGVDPYDKSNYDLILDSTIFKVKEIVDKLLSKLI